MKSLEKLQRVMDFINYYNTDGKFDSAKTLLHEFMCDNEVKQKKTTIRDFCTKDKGRSVLMGVYHDNENKCAVATDGIALIVSNSEYNEEFAGKIIDKYGNPVDGRFPKYNTVFPHHMETYTSYPLSADDIRSGLKQMKAYIKQNSIKHYALFAIHEDTRVAFSPEHLIKFADFSDGSIAIADACKPAVSASDTTKVLCMPKYCYPDFFGFETSINGWSFKVAC